MLLGEGVTPSENVPSCAQEGLPGLLKVVCVVPHLVGDEVPLPIWCQAVGTSGLFRAPCGSPESPVS